MAKQPEDAGSMRTRLIAAQEKILQVRSGLKDVVGGTNNPIKDSVTGEAIERRLTAAQHHISRAGKVAGTGLKVAAGVGKATVEGFGTAVKGLAFNVPYLKTSLGDLQHIVEAQGALYRELVRNRRPIDSIFIGGESIAALSAASHIPSDIIKAYEAAYPQLAQAISFKDRVLTLEEEALPGFLSGVKGKLFEQKYVEYLNADNLPDGYEAYLAASATQPGWDIAVRGPDQGLVSIIQAKATDSVSYVVAAMRQNPAIDVVTTDEVYSHLVLSGISEGLINSGISNLDLVDSLDAAAGATTIDFTFMPPWFTLAFIAFTSYKAESLTLYRRLELAGDRTGRAYLAYLIGGGVAALTNTWWLGVLASISSRYMSETALRNAKLHERLTKTRLSNRLIIERLQARPTSSMLKP